MTLRTPQPLPERFCRDIGPLTRRIVEKRHQSRWNYRLERWGRYWGRAKASVRAMRRYVWVMVGGGLLVGTVLVIGVAFFSSLLHVKEIRVRRNDLRMDMEFIERVLHPLFGRHLFFIHASEVEMSLKDTIPDIDGIVLNKEYPVRLVVGVKLKPIIVRLSLATVESREEHRTATGDTLQDFLTDDGLYVQYRAAQVPHTSELPLVYLVDWGIKPQPGRFLLEPQLLGQMLEAEKILRDRFGQRVGARTVFVRGREFHMALDKYTLWFDEQSSLTDQFGRYTLFLQALAGETPAQYVDLRLRDRVVYR